MPRLKQKLPSYRLHRSSRQAVVTLSGRDYYLGSFNAPESRAEYDRLIREWLANQRQIMEKSVTKNGKDQGVTINELISQYWVFASGYYVKNLKPTSELHALRFSFKPLVALYGTTTVDVFGPSSLKAVRQKMIDNGLFRTLINRLINRIRRIFKWGVENELVRSSTLEALRAVAPLKRGRCAVRESDPVKPAPESLITAIESYVSRQVWAMIQVQLLTAMRPGEVIQMRRRDIDTTGAVWLYRPESHKTEHHGIERSIYLGPQAQKFVMPFLNRADDDYLFSPLEADGLLGQIIGGLKAWCSDQSKIGFPVLAETSGHVLGRFVFRCIQACGHQVITGLLQGFLEYRYLHQLLLMKGMEQVPQSFQQLPSVGDGGRFRQRREEPHIPD